MKVTATFAFGAIALVACVAPRGEILSVTPTSATYTYTPNSAAIRLLSHARCVHEGQCGSVGPDAPFATEADCTVVADLDARSAVGLDACPYGVHEAQLRRCLDAIQAGACENPMRSLADVPGCGYFVLCR